MELLDHILIYSDNHLVWLQENAIFFQSAIYLWSNSLSAYDTIRHHADEMYIYGWMMDDAWSQ